MVKNRKQLFIVRRVTATSRYDYYVAAKNEDAAIEKAKAAYKFGSFLLTETLGEILT